MLRNFILSALGLVMVFTPLALWVAWTETIYYTLLSVWVAAFYLLHLIDTYSGREPG